MSPLFAVGGDIVKEIRKKVSDVCLDDTLDSSILLHTQASQSITPFQY